MDDGPLVQQYKAFPFGPLSPGLKQIFEQYPFPEGLDREYCQQSTREFALSKTGFCEIQRELTWGEEYFITRYPLPISEDEMAPLWEATGRIMSPFVDRKKSNAGLVIKFQNGDTIGWFIGLVEHIMADRKAVDDLYWVQVSYQFDFPVVRFTDSMILLEGDLDKSVIRQLKDYKKYYNENILGKFTVGRPRYDPEDYLGPARSIIQRYPDITQKDLVKRIGCDERTFRRWREIAKFDSFRQFKNSVLKK